MRICIAAFGLALVLAESNASAVLGHDTSSIAEDQARLGSARMKPLAVASQGVRMHEIVLPDGSSVREYVTPGGIVFAVAWSTRFKPRLGSLLGERMATYETAAGKASKRRGIQRSVVLTGDDLVTHSTSHLNSFVGKAYAPSLVPSGFDLHEIR